MKIRNTFIIFLKWFWHGANWTFIAWGFINALYFFAVVTLNKTDPTWNRFIAVGFKFECF
jgi:D-alanyl-lipoteichoic acid acyltransferase DltB (MBOAT superfamily)